MTKEDGVGWIKSPEVRSARARYAALTRSRGSDDPELLSASAALREASILAYVERTVAAMPSLSIDARSRLALLVLEAGQSAIGSHDPDDTDLIGRGQFEQPSDLARGIVKRLADSVRHSSISGAARCSNVVPAGTCGLLAGHDGEHMMVLDGIAVLHWGQSAAHIDGADWADPSLAPNLPLTPLVEGEYRLPESIFPDWIGRGLLHKVVIDDGRYHNWHALCDDHQVFIAGPTLAQLGERQRRGEQLKIKVCSYCTRGISAANRRPK